MRDFKIGDIVVWDFFGRKVIGVFNGYSILQNPWVFVLDGSREDELHISEIRHATPEEVEDFKKLVEN